MSERDQYDASMHALSDQLRDSYHLYESLSLGNDGLDALQWHHSNEFYSSLVSLSSPDVNMGYNDTHGTMAIAPCIGTHH